MKLYVTTGTITTWFLAEDDKDAGLLAQRMLERECEIGNLEVDYGPDEVVSLNDIPEDVRDTCPLVNTGGIASQTFEEWFAAKTPI